MGEFWRLPAYSPDQIEAFWTGVGALAAVAASIVAIVTLVALRRDSTDRTRPMLYAELRPVLLVTIPERALVLRNGGATPAHNVRVTFEPPLPAFDQPGDEQKLTRFLKRRYDKTIATWPPGMELSNLYFIGVAGSDGQVVNREPVPDAFAVTICYQDIRGRKYTDTYNLDDRVWPDETRATPGDTDENGLRRREVRAVEAIARGVGRY